MRVLVTGATGFVGRAVCRRLLAAGHEIRAVARDPHGQWPAEGLEWVAGDFALDHDPSAWTGRLDGVDAVVNAVGIIRETRSASFEAVHGRAPRALFDAAAAIGLRRAIQISAMGVDAPGASLPYQTSKAATDRHLLELDLPAVILRPSLVVGREGQSARLFRGLATLPIVPIVGRGEYGLRPIHVDDLAEAVRVALEATEVSSAAYDLGGSERVTLKEHLLATRAWLGERANGPVVHIPIAWMKPAAWFGDLTGAGPLDSDLLTMLRSGADNDVSAFTRAFGFTPRGLREFLADDPADEPLRLAARFELMRGPIRWLVASIWLITPIVTLVQWDLGLELLAKSGFGGPAAPVLLVASCGLELVLAAALLADRSVRLVGWIQIALMAFYSLTLSVTEPSMWLDPFGALAKNLPLVAATLAMIALAEPRGRRR